MPFFSGGDFPGGFSGVGTIATSTRKLEDGTVRILEDDTTRMLEG